MRFIVSTGTSELVGRCWSFQQDKFHNYFSSHSLSPSSNIIHFNDATKSNAGNLATSLAKWFDRSSFMKKRKKKHILKSSFTAYMMCLYCNNDAQFGYEFAWPKLCLTHVIKCFTNEQFEVSLAFTSSLVALWYTQCIYYSKYNVKALHIHWLVNV